MTLADTLLEKLDGWKPTGDSPHTFAILDPAGTTVRAAVERLDELGCRLGELCVTRSASAAANEPSLSDWATRVADRVTGLLEPLKVVEVDSERGQALLRSDQPAQKADDRLYYEVLLHRTGAATVRRYKGSVQPVKRQPVAFTLTREALGKLVEDLVATA